MFAFDKGITLFIEDRGTGEVEIVRYKKKEIDMKPSLEPEYIEDLSKRVYVATNEATGEMYPAWDVLDADYKEAYMAQIKVVYMQVAQDIVKANPALRTDKGGSISGGTEEDIYRYFREVRDGG